MSICDLDSDAGENACEELGETFGKERVLFCHCDVTDYVQFEEAFQTTIGEFDGLDIVVNNAEIMNDKFWELEVDVNLNGTIRGMLLALQYLGKNKEGEHCLHFLWSIFGYLSFPSHAIIESNIFSALYGFF